MVLTISFTRGIRIGYMVHPAKKKLWFAFYNAFENAWWTPDEVKALDELKVAVVAAFQEAQNAIDKALASEKKEELEAVRAMPTEMVPGADERKRKKNGMRKRKRESREELKADRVVAADTGPGDDEMR